MDEFRRIAIEQCFEDLFSKKYYDICTLDKIIDLTNTVPNRRVYEELRAFHCVNYSKMQDRTRQLVQEKTIECLRGDPVFMNPARMTNTVLDDGNDFAFIEDRYIDQPKR